MVLPACDLLVLKVSAPLSLRMKAHIFCRLTRLTHARTPVFFPASLSSSDLQTNKAQEKSLLRLRWATIRKVLWLPSRGPRQAGLKQNTPLHRNSYCLVGCVFSNDLYLLTYLLGKWATTAKTYLLRCLTIFSINPICLKKYVSSWIVEIHDFHAALKSVFFGKQPTQN